VKDSCFKFINCSILLLIAFLYISSIARNSIGVDASYFLRMSECIRNGFIPSIDLRVGYTPMVFYTILPLSLFENTPFPIYLTFMYFVQAVCAFIIYKINCTYTSNKNISLLGALTYLLLAFKLEGNNFTLEPFVNLWGLASLFILLKRKTSIFLLHAGFFIFLSFWSKQFGVFYFFINVLVLFSQNDFKIGGTLKQSTVLIVGFAFGFLFFNICFFFYYGSIYKINDAFNSTTYGERSVSQFLSGVKNYFFISFYLILLFVPVIFKKVFSQNKSILIFILAALLFSIQLILNQFSHYYILIIPFLIFIGVIMIETYIASRTKTVLTFILLSFFVCEAFLKPRISSYAVTSLINSATDSDLASSYKINKLIPENSKVYLAENPERKFYFLCHFNAAVPKKYGFSFGNFIHRNAFMEILNESEYFIINQKQLEQNKLNFIDFDITNLSEVLNKKKYRLLAVVGNYNLFKNMNL
jgi:hypothetical protein